MHATKVNSKLKLAEDNYEFRCDMVITIHRIDKCIRILSDIHKEYMQSINIYSI